MPRGDSSSCRGIRMSVRSDRHCQRRLLQSIFRPERLWGRGRGRRDVTTLLKHMLWYGRTGYSIVAMKMDSRSSRDSGMEEHAIPECREGTKSRRGIRRTPRNQVHAGGRQRCVSSGEDGVGLAHPVLAPWLDKSGDRRH